jgi:hypothetical protein
MLNRLGFRQRFGIDTKVCQLLQQHQQPDKAIELVMKELRDKCS